jgi:hypothetical protein
MSPSCLVKQLLELVMLLVAGIGAVDPDGNHLIFGCETKAT